MKRASNGASLLSVLAVSMLFTAIISFASLPVALAAESNGGSKKAVIIHQPADNAVVHGNSVDVVIELRDRGRRGDHVHLYLDGRLVKPLYGDKITYTINRLGHGAHKIVVRLATKRHKILEANDFVTINVR